jgi:hypothetical protein
MFILSIVFQAVGHAIYAGCKNVGQYIVSYSAYVTYMFTAHSG